MTTASSASGSKSSFCFFGPARPELNAFKLRDIARGRAAAGAAGRAAAWRGREGGRGIDRRSCAMSLDRETTTKTKKKRRSRRGMLMGEKEPRARPKLIIIATTKRPTRPLQSLVEATRLSCCLSLASVPREDKTCNLIYEPA